MPLRACDDDFDTGFEDGFEDDLDVDVDLGAARPDRLELWARDFFEGPHVFIVEPTVPTGREPNRASSGA